MCLSKITYILKHVRSQEYFIKHKPLFLIASKKVLDRYVFILPMRFFTNWDNQHPFLKYINFFGPRFDPFVLLFGPCFSLVLRFVFVWFGH